MERRFGVDFSGARIHADSNAVQMSRELSAQAFTHGRDIYFGAGRYSPGTSSDKRLLAHELTHVVQQNNNDKVIIQKSKSKFFSVLRALKVQWIFPVILGILWLFRHATAGSLTEKERMRPSTLAVFKKKSRQYIGFILIGILLGLLLSFFLPDFLGDFADWIWKKLKNLF